MSKKLTLYTIYKDGSLIMFEDTSVIVRGGTFKLDESLVPLALHDGRVSLTPFRKEDIWREDDQIEEE